MVILKNNLVATDLNFHRELERQFEKLKEVKNKITSFFNQRKISVKEYFITCGETVKDFAEVEEYNNRVAEMILGITTPRQII